MPIYEYKCSGCGEVFEYIQRISDDPKKVCERCGGALERLISQTSFTLKGGGWYKDLYSSPKPDAGTSGKSATPSEGKSKGDSKPTASSDAGGGGKPGSSTSS